MKFKAVGEGKKSFLAFNFVIQIAFVIPFCWSDEMFPEKRKMREQHEIFTKDFSAQTFCALFINKVDWKANFSPQVICSSFVFTLVERKFFVFVSLSFILVSSYKKLFLDVRLKGIAVLKEKKMSNQGSKFEGGYWGRIGVKRERRHVALEGCDLRLKQKEWQRGFDMLKNRFLYPFRIGWRWINSALLTFVSPSAAAW